MNTNNKIIINTLDKLIEFEADLKKTRNNYFFRGQFNSDWILESSYKREFRKRNNLSLEKNITSKYLILTIEEQIKYIKNKSSEKKNDLQILAELQHYGSPTLLIDFTANFWTALWFAISEINFQDKLPEYFRLYYLKLEKDKTEKYSMKNINIKDIYHCPDMIKNGLAQKSYFIVDNLDNLETYWNIKSILINFDFKDELLKFLDSSKISSNTIFPGLKGLYQGFQNYSDEFMILSGLQLLEIGNYDKAIRYFERALEISPNSVDANNNMGITFIKKEKPNEAFKYFEKSIELDPTFIYGYTSKANVLVSMKKYNEAIKVLNKALKISPNEAIIYHCMGLTLAEMNKNIEAIEYYNKAIELDPNYFIAYEAKGNVLSKLEEYNKALDEYNKVIAIDWTYASAYYNKGNTLADMGRKIEAIKYFDKAIELEPSSIDAYINKAITLNEIGNHYKAIECFDKVIEINSNYIFSYIGKGDVLIKINKLEEANTQYNKALELKGTCKEANFGKGNISFAKREYEEAIKFYNKALELDINYIDAYINKGTTLIVKNDLEQAQKCFNKVLNLNPGNMLAIRRLNQIKNKMKSERKNYEK